MSKEKMLDKQLNTLNTYLATLLAILVGLFGFVFSSLGGVIKCEMWVVYCAIFGIIIAVCLLCFLQKFINKKLNELGAL